MVKTIKFASKEEHLIHPQPARKYIPDWYRKAEKFLGGKPIISSNSDLGNTTIKACMPFLDTLTTGYIVELWQDIQVTVTNGEPLVTWATSPSVVALRGTVMLQNLPVGEEHYNLNFAWDYPFLMQTPKNYSSLITHPFNRYDLPFTTMTGIADSDIVMANGSVPFLLKKNFEGIIPKGTPIAQILPFKRDNWESIVDESIIEASAFNSANVRRTITGWYKRNVWKKKSYN